MNILFYLVPKSEVVYIYDDYSLRQTMEKMEHHRYTSVPVINRQGYYVGSLTEGDILWYLKSQNILDMRETEDIPVRKVRRCRDNEAVNVNCRMEDLLTAAMNQNFVPVVDDNDTFIGIITRKGILTYLGKKLSEKCNEKDC